MEHIKRDKMFWGFFRWILGGWIKRKLNITALPVEAEGPYLVLANHATDWDPFMIALSFKPHMYFVASEHIFRWGPVWKIINWLLHPIARLKGTTASDTVMTVMRRMKKGANIAIFADGNRTWTGKSGSILPSTGKLARSCGGSLITYKLEGGYFTSPRWAGKSLRRGKMRGYAVGIYSREQLRAMTPEQINEIIRRDLEEDAYARQREHPVAFVGKKLAEGLENMLCVCPKCGRIGTLKSSGDHLTCDCGLTARYTEYGFLTGPDVPFDNIADWDEWQTETLYGLADDTLDGEVIFSDRDISMDLLKSRHDQTFIGQGELALYRDRLVFMKCEFPLKNISGMGMHGPLGLSFTVGTEHYELSSSKPVSLRKYMTLYDYIRRSDASGEKAAEHGRRLGLTT